jgi:Carboxylesterase family
MTNEFAFWHSVHRIVQQRWRSGGSGRSFVYRFDVNTENNCFSNMQGVDPLYREPIHMDDICYLFRPSFTGLLIPNSAGWNMTQHMLDIYTRFAATGNPGVAGWTHSTGADGAAPLVGYNIRESEASFGELPEAPRMEVWDTFYNDASSLIKTFNFSLLVLVVIKQFL